ncbi:hypothetical protein BGX27_011517 [Mortierella sp. AM989]|nr:hypothetical protein BGX27_011517 [Mortierella sp. AM989]
MAFEDVQIAKPAPETYKALEADLCDHSGKTPLHERFRALFTLKALADDASVDIIGRAFADESALLKHELAYVLGQMKNPHAHTVLKQVLGTMDEDPMVRHEAAEALGAIGSLESIPILEEYLKDESSVVSQTCELAIEKIKYDYRKEKEVLPESSYSSIDPAPPTADEDSTEHLREIYLNQKLPLFERYRAMFALRNQCTTESVLALADGFDDPSALFRHEIAYVFGQMQHPAAVPSLVKVLSKLDEANMVRHEAAEALGSIATPECYPVLEKFRDDKERVVRESCIVALDMYEYENSGQLQYADGLSNMHTKNVNKQSSGRFTRLARLVPLALVAATAVIPQAFAQVDNGWFNLTVIHTNDVHSRLDPANNLGIACTAADIAQGNCYGGAARHKTLVQQLRSGKQNSLLLDGGDEFQGTLYYNYYKGNVTAEAMNDIGYDLSTIGNHEWDDGPSNAARFWAQLKMPVVCANIDFTKNPDLAKLVKPYHIFEDMGVAIIGYITPFTGDISNSGPTVSFTDPIVAVQKYIDELQGKGIKRILALSHNGYAPDMELAAKTRGLDLIVGGHSHSYLGDPKNPLYQGPYPTVIKNLDGENTLIVQAYCWGRFIGNLDVSFNPEGKIVSWNGGPVQVENSIPADPALLQKVDGWRSKFEEWARTVLGQASESFELTGCRTRDCTVGNLISDATLKYVRESKPLTTTPATKGGNKKPKDPKKPWADVVIINTGGIRAGIPKGNVTVETAITILPFGGVVLQTPMKGQELLTSLEAVSAGRRKDNGKTVTSFIQVSGMRFVYDPSRNATGKTLIKAEIQDKKMKWRKISPEKTYSVVTTDFLLNGGDNIFLKQNRTGTIQYMKHDEVLMDFVKKAKVISPYLDGRIRNAATPALVARSDEQEDDRSWVPEHLKRIFPLSNEQLLEEYRRVQG